MRGTTKINFSENVNFGFTRILHLLVKVYKGERVLVVIASFKHLLAI